MKNRVSGIILILFWNLEFAICISFSCPMHIFLRYIITNLALVGYTFIAKFSIFKWKKIRVGVKIFARSGDSKHSFFGPCETYRYKEVGLGLGDWVRNPVVRVVVWILLYWGRHFINIRNSVSLKNTEEKHYKQVLYWTEQFLKK
jgi:hypothetical protein